MNNEILRRIENANQIIVITHIGPDGDAIGSLTAVGQALIQLGKTPHLVCDDGVPERFSYLPQTNQVEKEPAPEPYDLLIAVDCGDELRMGDAYRNLIHKPAILNIDHHVTNTMFGDVNIVKPEATSTTEILFDLFQAFGIQLSEKIALSLLTGLVTDTLGFRTAGVTANTLNVASQLIEAGADLAFVTMQALNVKPLTTVQLWQIGLANMKIEEGFIWTTISQDEQGDIGFVGSGTNGLVNILADIDIAHMGAAILELPDGSVRVGFRCRQPFDVSTIATELGGGGHPLASGCSIDGPLDIAEAKVREVTLNALRRQKMAVSL
ncbi:MAG: bifunctional oligoribonuclease/PAP phosphatase NrnA [Chloroflexota bacterium]